jgi:cellobiose-specific phosphotransferase system component IIC
MRALEPYLPYAPAFQIVVVFVMLGGSIIVVTMLTAAVIAAAKYRRQIIAALEPWWQIQSSIPSGIRKPLAILAAGFVGYYFGKRAGGQEWTYTLISISFGIAVAFLIIFTPPDSARQAKRS